MAEASAKPIPGSALAHLVAGIDLDFQLAASERPHAVRRRVQAALAFPELYLDCAELLLAQLLHEPDSRFLFADGHGRYALQLFCWPPGFGNEPHLHESWNVSAIMSQSLLVFRSAVSKTDCLASEPLLATCGKAGVLVPPQFHCLRNPGDETAITFHVFSTPEPRDRIVDPEHRPSVSERFDDDDILAIATVAATTGNSRSVGVVRSAFSAAGVATKLELVKLMARLSPVEAILLGRTLAALVGGHDGQRLLGVIDRLEAGAAKGVLQDR